MAGWGASVRGVPATLATMSTIRKRFSSSAMWVVGTNVEYAIYVEFGTSRMSAQPYLRPAIEHAKRNSGAWFRSSSSLDEFVAKVALGIEAEAKRQSPVDTGRLRASIKAEKIR